MIHSAKWIFIRFNPDKYKDKDGKTKNPLIKTRLEKLQLEINNQITKINDSKNTELIEIIKLYFDEN